MFPRLLLLFIAIPVIELVLLIQIGGRIGLWATIAIIFATAIIGASLTRMQGAMTMARAQNAIREGRTPTAEMLDGLMIVIAGVVLLTPGFLTDAIGFALLVPSVRAACRNRLAKSLVNRVQFTAAPSTAPDAESGSAWQDDDSVIEAELVDDDS
jgi:UPF0716 protein FxsA